MKAMRIMMKKQTGIGAILIVGLLIGPAFASLFTDAPPFVGEESGSAAAASKYFRQKSGLVFESKWGAWARSRSGLYMANTVKVHPGGEIYVVSAGLLSAGEKEFAYHRAQRFSPQGKYLGWFGGYKSGYQQPSWICSPKSASFAPNGDVYLLAGLGGSLKTYTAKGTVKGSFSAYGGSGGPAYFPDSVCGDKDGLIYASVMSVTDGYINKFDANGTVLNVINEDTLGEKNGFKYGPNGLACDRFGNLYACDRDNDRVVKFGPEGVLLGEFKGARMTKPTETAVSPDGSLYVLAENTVYRFYADGKLISASGGPGTADGQFRNAASLSCAPDGRVLVLDSDYDAKIASVKIFRPAYYGHKYKKLNLAGKVSGLAAADLALLSVAAEGEDAAGNVFFALVRPAGDGRFSFLNFPLGAAYRISLRGLNTLVYLEAADIVGTAKKSVTNLKFVVVKK